MCNAIQALICQNGKFKFFTVMVIVTRNCPTVFIYVRPMSHRCCVSCCSLVFLDVVSSLFAMYYMSHCHVTHVVSDILHHHCVSYCVLDVTLSLCVMLYPRYHVITHCYHCVLYVTSSLLMLCPKCHIITVIVVS